MPIFNEAVTIKGPLTIENKSDLQAFVLVDNNGPTLTIKRQAIGGNIAMILPTPDGSGEQQIVLDDLIQTLKRKTLLTPKIETALYDKNGSQWITQIDPPTSVVNYLEVGNAATGAAVRVRAAGGDNNISINLIPKGSGTLQVNGVELASVTTTVTLAGTQTLTNKTLTAPVLSGTVTGTYTLGGTPTLAGATINTSTLNSPAIEGNLTGSFTLAGVPTFQNDVTCTAGFDFILATSGAGTRIGTGVTQLLGFYGATAIVQPASGSAAAVATTAATSTTPFGYTTAAQADGIITLLNELRLELVNLGLIKGAA